jgi:dienelactone hydrolase
MATADSGLTVGVDGRDLPGTLTVPRPCRGVVVFAHGSGSSRHSPRNVRVAQVLQQHGLATLLFDLLTADEERADAVDGHLRFDVELLSRRLDAAVRAAAADPRVAALPVGLFGASTGAAAALITAARLPGQVYAVVSRGGRPDLAGAALAQVRAPVLLIVGGRDSTVVELNRQAAGLLGAEHEVVVVRGATHLFAEPGALDEVARLAADWFVRQLPAPAAGEEPSPGT